MSVTQLSIGQVAERAGVRPSTIRYSESINIRPTPQRRGGQRRYDAAVLERLAQPIDEAAPLSDRWHTLANRKLAEMDSVIRQAASIRRLLARGLRCDCPNLHDCIHCVLAHCRDTPQL